MLQILTQEGDEEGGGEVEENKPLASFPLQAALLWVTPKLGKGKRVNWVRDERSVLESDLLWTRAAGEQGRSEM